MKKLMIVLLLVILIALLGSAYWINNHEAVPVENAGQAVHAPQDQVFLTYKEEEYPLKEHLRTVLLIGTDSTERYEEDENLLLDYYNANQADFLILLVQDTEANTTEVIQLNRDTMTDVPILGVTGAQAGTRREQLALAYYYGQGEEDSCENTVAAVSNLLYGAPIDHYIAVTMDAVPIMNDWAGGVRLEILDDFTAINPDLIQGTEALLLGEDALHYVKTRAGLSDSTNLNRMERQRQYASAWFEKAKPRFNDYQALAELMDDVEPYYYSSCSLEQLKDLASAFADHPPEISHQLPGQAVTNQFMEFHVDEPALQALVLDLFYKPIAQ